MEKEFRRFALMLPAWILFSMEGFAQQNALAQAHIYIGGYRLEAEISTVLSAATPAKCPEIPTQEFGSPYSIGSPKVNGNPVNANCGQVNYNLRPTVVHGITGTLQCDAVQFYECVAILYDATTGKQLWGDNFKHQGFLSRPPSYVDFRGKISRKLVLQLYTFSAGHY
jgi:hypothetical protein